MIDTPDISAARSFLFVPASRPDRFPKAMASGADRIIVDLEDAVAPAEKVAARQHAANWFGAGNPPAVLRVNAADTRWFADDIQLAARFRLPVMLAKAEIAETIADLSASTGASVIPLIETAEGLRCVAGIASVPGAVRLAFGSIDFAAELGVDFADREALQSARSALVYASAAARIAAPIDGVTTAINDLRVLSSDVAYAARLGMTAKLCIHPHQIDAVHQHFVPTPEQIQWANKVLIATTRTESLAVIDGHMVDPPVVKRAQRIMELVNQIR